MSILQRAITPRTCSIPTSFSSSYDWRQILRNEHIIANMDRFSAHHTPKLKHTPLVTQGNSLFPRKIREPPSAPDGRCQRRLLQRVPHLTVRVSLERVEIIPQCPAEKHRFLHKRGRWMTKNQNCDAKYTDRVDNTARLSCNYDFIGLSLDGVGALQYITAAHIRASFNLSSPREGELSA